MTLSGPMFEPADSPTMKSAFGKQGAHYNIYYFGGADAGRSAIKEFFPDASHIDEMNLVLFSTSGVHGSYATIEEVCGGVEKYGDEPDFDDEGWPDDYHGDELTVTIYQPRLVCLRYGNMRVLKGDMPWLKSLRAASRKVFRKIG